MIVGLCVSFVWVAHPMAGMSWMSGVSVDIGNR